MPLRFLKTWKLDDIEKRPLVVLIAFLIALNFFIITRKDSREEASKTETKFWQEKYVDLTTNLLEKNKIIEKQGEEIENLKAIKTDSVVREEVAEPVKNILK